MEKWLAKLTRKKKSFCTHGEMVLKFGELDPLRPELRARAAGSLPTRSIMRLLMLRPLQAAWLAAS
jgi:hypothetical protein